MIGGGFGIFMTDEGPGSIAPRGFWPMDEFGWEKGIIVTYPHMSAPFVVKNKHGGDLWFGTPQMTRGGSSVAVS